MKLTLLFSGALAVLAAAKPLPSHPNSVADSNWSKPTPHYKYDRCCHRDNVKCQKRFTKGPLCNDLLHPEFVSAGKAVGNAHMPEENASTGIIADNVDETLTKTLEASGKLTKAVRDVDGVAERGDDAAHETSSDVDVPLVDRPNAETHGGINPHASQDAHERAVSEFADRHKKVDPFQGTDTGPKFDSKGNPLDDTLQRGKIYKDDMGICCVFGDKRCPHTMHKKWPLLFKGRWCLWSTPGSTFPRPFKVRRDSGSITAAEGTATDVKEDETRVMDIIPLWRPTLPGDIYEGSDGLCCVWPDKKCMHRFGGITRVRWCRFGVPGSPDPRPAEPSRDYKTATTVGGAIDDAEHLMSTDVHHP